MQPVAFIPSPSQGVWHLGFVPIRAYALMIILGIVVAVWLGERRWAAKGGAPGVIVDIAVWAVPFGLIGGRLYHVLTDYQRYFGEGRDPVDALKIWEGGLGIWGAVLLGAVGALIGCRRRGISVAALGDAVAPGIALAQAIGRWGNYFNQELYGRPLDTFWGLKIDQAHRPRLADGSLDPRYADIATYHPTFLYESLWCVGVAFLVLWADRRFKLTHGRAFALYVAAYTFGRFWVELLRIDDAHHILGMRLNDWTSLIVFLGAVGYLYWARGKSGPEEVGAAPRTEPEASGSAEGGDDPDGEGPAASTPPAGSTPPEGKDGEAPEKPVAKPVPEEAAAEAAPAPAPVDAPEPVDDPEPADDPERETAAAEAVTDPVPAPSTDTDTTDTGTTPDAGTKPDAGTTPDTAAEPAGTGADTAAADADSTPETGENGVRDDVEPAEAGKGAPVKDGK
ncbi:prolipoprotein diacylglyceryl transferase [Actinomadura viridis]|uniref:prolipoprotein diacylglyceryl transferase n=1 Tax=Actinomadura viridis TaxID=58110 RepID=UPI00369C9586